ncbi:MAG TPA: ATP-binding cassette domain-containing protein [Stellaceae bacterium]
MPAFYSLAAESCPAAFDTTRLLLTACNLLPKRPIGITSSRPRSMRSSCLVIGSGWIYRGGESRRVSLAQMLVGDPDILLLDEPTNHFDIPAVRFG